MAYKTIFETSKFLLEQYDNQTRYKITYKLQRKKSCVRGEAAKTMKTLIAKWVSENRTADYICNELWFTYDYQLGY